MTFKLLQKTPNKDLKGIYKSATQWKMNLILDTIEQTQDVIFSQKGKKRQKIPLFSINLIIPNTHKMVKQTLNIVKQNGKNRQTNIAARFLTCV